jgi:hypothetical protein
MSDKNQAVEQEQGQQEVINTNLDLWSQVEVTNPAYVKQFDRSGFTGTSINPTYLAQKATQAFGPMGIGWGLDIVEEKFQEGAPLFVNDLHVGKEVIHIIRAKLWYIWNGVKGEIVQFGQTPFVGMKSSGPYTDEDAPKKSLTDAMSKCLSLLGFSADIYTGAWDTNKYINNAVDQDGRAVETDGAAKQADQSAKPAATSGDTSTSKPTQPKAQKPTGAYRKQEPEPPIDVEAETARFNNWKEALVRADLVGLENAKMVISKNFRDPALREAITKLFDEKHRELTAAALETA